jgi:soluble lytic murein transglycosylase-like protein
VSLDSALARVADLQAFTASLAPSPAPATAQVSTEASASFAPMLQAALQTGAPAAATAGPAPYDAEIEAAAARHGVDPNLVRAVIRHESGFDPTATSSAGAMGLMQLMPGTASGLGVTDPYDPVQSIEGGTKYLKSLLDRFGGDVRLAVGGYNAGPGAVERYGGVPPYVETQRYVDRVLGAYTTTDERSVP